MSLTASLKSSWPLFLGIALLMVGNGLQGTLLSVRATMEGFSLAMTGLIMSLYFAGYLAGSAITPCLIKNVGHIRVFAAFASLASTTSILHGLLIDPWIWAAARIITGFCFAGLYIVIESWMSDISTNECRGKIMGAYLLTFYGATVLGQYLMNIAPPEKVDLFAIVSVIISVALLPVALSKRPAPKFEDSVPVKIRDVYQASPLGVVGIFLGSLANGTFFALGPAFALNQGMDVKGIASFIALFAIGGVVLQFPAGFLSDKIGRRKVILAVSFCASLTTGLCFIFSQIPMLLFGLVFLYGCTALCIYGLCLALTNDHLSNEKFVGACAALAIVNGIGALIGPFLASLVMTGFGQNAFFPFLSAVYGALFLFGLVRAGLRPALTVEEQGVFIAMASPATPATAHIAEKKQDIKEG